MKVNKNMVSGNSAMLVLKLLSEKDMYGYEMIDALVSSSATPIVRNGRHG